MLRTASNMTALLPYCERFPLLPSYSMLRCAHAGGVADEARRGEVRVARRALLILFPDDGGSGGNTVADSRGITRSPCRSSLSRTGRCMKPKLLAAVILSKLCELALCSSLRLWRPVPQQHRSIVLHTQTTEERCLARQER